VSDDWTLNAEAIANLGYMQMKKTNDAAMVIIERMYGERPRFKRGRPLGVGALRKISGSSSSESGPANLWPAPDYNRLQHGKSRQPASHHETPIAESSGRQSAGQEEDRFRAD
jgi:hypothetical protein